MKVLGLAMFMQSTATTVCVAPPSPDPPATPTNSCGCQATDMQKITVPALHPFSRAALQDKLARDRIVRCEPRFWPDFLFTMWPAPVPQLWAMVGRKARNDRAPFDVLATKRVVGGHAGENVQQGCSGN